MLKIIRQAGLLYASFVLVFFSCMVHAAIAEPGIPDPQKEVSETINTLIDRLSDNAEEIKTDKAVAYAISDELITPSIDFKRVTRLVIGKHWRTASEAQRQQLVEEVRDLMIRSYTTAMTSYADDIIAKKDRISYLPSRYKAGDKKASVRSLIELDSGQKADVQYKLLYTGGKWKIYDISIEGVSMAITYRTTFGQEIERDGLDALIAKLADRNRKGEVELPDDLATSE